MKIIDGSVSILEQEPGIVGMFKHIERVARTSYQSESATTDDSYIKFCDMIKKRGHWSCFEHGTVYLKIPKSPKSIVSEKLKLSQYVKYTEDKESYYFTTNYRTILSLFANNEGEYILRSYWCEPDKNFYRRVTSYWICSRGVSHELVRHRIMSFLQSSQRYIAYDLEKNGGELTFILPQWVYSLRDEISKSVDTFTGESRGFLKSITGFELWKELCCLDRTVAARDNFWKGVETQYIWERTTDESYKLKPEDARGILVNDIETKVCVTGFLSDYLETPKKDTTEKKGFLYLRTAKDAHPDFRVLAESLESQLNEKYKKDGDIK